MKYFIIAILALLFIWAVKRYFFDVQEADAESASPFKQVCFSNTHELRGALNWRIKNFGGIRVITDKEGEICYKIAKEKYDEVKGWI